MNFKHFVFSAAAGIFASAAAFAGVMNGESAPDFTLTNSDGEQVSLSDFRGQPVVLEWSNFDCPFVAKHYNSGNMPQLQQTYAEQDVVWLTIMSSAPGKQGHYPGDELNARADKEGNAAMHILRDEDGTVGKLYGAETTPHMYVIDAEGVLHYQGAIDSNPSFKPEDIEGATNYVVNALEALKNGEAVEPAQTKAYGCSVKYAG